MIAAMPVWALRRLTRWVHRSVFNDWLLACPRGAAVGFRSEALGVGLRAVRTDGRVAGGSCRAKNSAGAFRGIREMHQGSMRDARMEGWMEHAPEKEKGMEKGAGTGGLRRQRMAGVGVRRVGGHSARDGGRRSGRGGYRRDRSEQHRSTRAGITCDVQRVKRGMCTPLHRQGQRGHGSFHDHGGSGAQTTGGRLPWHDGHWVRT